jgi:hypothetical protein
MSDIATNQSCKDRQQPPEAGRGKAEVPPVAFVGNMALPTVCWLGTLHLWFPELRESILVVLSPKFGIICNGRFKK